MARADFVVVKLGKINASQQRSDFACYYANVPEGLK
jgi:hypothetical protein